MTCPSDDETERLQPWLTNELRHKVAELAQQPDGDFCADLATWLIDAGHVPLPSQTIARDQEPVATRMQHDRAWHQLAVLEQHHRVDVPPASEVQV